MEKAVNFFKNEVGQPKLMKDNILEEFLELFKEE